MKNYTDRAKAATLRQLLVIKYLNRVETVVDWPTFQRMLMRGVTAGDDFILEELSVFKTENTRLSILLKKVLRG